MALEIRVLGRVDALVDGRSLPLRGSKQRGVLAMLALRANRTVSAEALIDGLWAERPPESAVKNVQTHVSRLRKALASGHCRASIVTHGRGYELKLPEESVDAVRFEHLVERARREADQAIPDGAAKEALELWRGAPLADVASEPFAEPEIRRLEELYLRATELAIDAELAAGRHGEVIGRLEALIAEHPLNERFYAQRMLALYRAGRQSEALAAYRQAHRTLTDEIGIEPGSELQRLQEQILAQDPSLKAPAPPAELPPQLEGGSPLLAGRERELRWLRERWAKAKSGRCRVALVSGVAGIGKTRLAAELAAELHLAGATVLYAAGSRASEAALDAVRCAGEAERPTLLVLDEADDAPPAVLEATVALVAQPRQAPAIVLVLCEDERAPPALADLAPAAASDRLTLDRLGIDAVAEIAALYATADGVAIPVERLIAESDGVALAVHRVASAWAQAQASERLEATASRTAGERGDLRTAQAELAGNVTELQVARERSDLYLVSEPVDSSAPEVCPFRGLAPFEAAQAEYFFGRERFTAELVARLVGSTLLAVFGPSGSGKSSVLRAGLLPALGNGVLPGSDRWRQVLIRPGAHPLAELGRALARLGSGQGDGDDPLAAALASLAPDERLVLAVDQFEEAFTACRDEAERARFVDALVGAAEDPDQRTVVVLAIRADFYGRCADYRALAAQISANQLLVGPMSREELRRAIELPARRAGLRVEPALVSALVDDVADQPGGLPLLSTALLELWQQHSGRTLRAASYAASGGVSGAVARLAERAYRRLTKPQRERARAILLRLADAEQPTVRRRVALSELETERDPEAAAALAVLTESRLVTVDEGSVEVAHEALLSEWPRLRGWLEEDAEGRRLHQHLIHATREWDDSGRDPAELYRGARLAAALDWASTHERELNELERAFLEESRAASERQAERQRRTNRRLRTLLAGVGVLLAAAIAAGVIALSERQSARSSAAAADSQRLGAQALTEDRLDRALPLAAAGVGLDDSAATRSSLLSVLVDGPSAVGVLNVDAELYSLGLSPDGRTLALGEADGTVILFDTETRERIGDYQAPGVVTWLGFHPRGGSLAIVAGLDGRASLHVIDVATQRLRGSVSLGDPADHGSVAASATYGPSERSVIVAYAGNFDHAVPMFLRRFDARTASPIGPAVRVASRSAFGVGSTPDGHLLVASDEATYAIDAQTLRVLRRYPVGAFTIGISADGATLALGGEDGAVRLLDLASGGVRTLPGRRDGTVVGEAFSPDGRTLATADDDGTVIVWDLTEGRAIETLKGHRDAVWSLAFGPDGRILYTAGSDQSAIIWDVAGYRRLARPFRTNIVSAKGSPDDDHRTPDPYAPPAFALSPDGRTLAAARSNGRVDLLDAETLRRTGGFEAFAGRSALAIDYSHDGRRLAVAGGGGGVGLWDAGSGKRIGPLLRAPRGRKHGNPYSIQALAFGRGGLLAAASLGGYAQRGVVRIWDIDGRKLIVRPLPMPPRVMGVAFSPDGSQLAIAFGASRDIRLRPASGGVEVRDVRSDETLARLPADDLRSVAFSPDGRLLAGGQADGNVFLWAADDWGRAGPPLASRGGQALSVAFSPNGRTLATSHSDGAVVLWNVESQQTIGPALPGLPDAWTTARFAPDGDRLFAVSDEGRAIRWAVDPKVWIQRACAVAGELTPEQWGEIVPEQDYISVCSSG